MPDNFNYYRGNLVEDPELRFTPNGIAVASFRIAVNERVKDANGEWKDGDATFLACIAWRDMAENAVEHLRRGQSAIVCGKLKQRSYETKEGEKRTVYEVECEDLGPSLKWKPKGQQQKKAAASSYADEPPF